MARAIAQLSPTAQKVYKQNPDLAAKRAQQLAGANGSGSASTSDASSPSASSISFPSPPLPGFVKEPLFVVLVLALGLMLYGRFVHPINLGLSRSSGPTGQPSATVQSYIDQQNRRVAIVSDTMPGRIIRVNPGKVGAA